MKTPKNFEDGLARLDALQAKISDPATPLAEAVKLYAEAAALIEFCNKMLTTAKLQIEEIDAKLAAASLQEGNDEL